MKKILAMVWRVLAAIAAVLFLIWFVSPMKANVINIGNIAGVALCVWTLVLCFKPIGRLLKRHTFTRILYRIVNVCFAVVMLYGAVVTAAMFITANSAPAENATVVLLGAQVKPSGEPSKILLGRINAAEAYLKEHPGSKAVLTGGKGADEAVSEADCMYQLLTQRGIAPERLYREDKASDTVENFRFSQKIIEQNGLNQNLAVTTDTFHLFRSVLIAKKQGITAQIGAVAATTELRYVPTYVVREWFALPTLLFK